MQAKKEPKSFAEPAYNRKLRCELGPFADFVKLQSEDKRSFSDGKAIAPETRHGTEEPLSRQPLVKLNEPVIDPGVIHPLVTS